jgi:hypothetical protein
VVVADEKARIEAPKASAKAAADPLKSELAATQNDSNKDDPFPRLWKKKSRMGRMAFAGPSAAEASAEAPRAQSPNGSVLRRGGLLIHVNGYDMYNHTNHQHHDHRNMQHVPE